jgi:hypothetical protein
MFSLGREPQGNVDKKKQSPGGATDIQARGLRLTPQP